MDIGILLTPLLLIATVVYVAWPMLRDEKEDSPLEATELEMALEEKENALSNLKDI